jgi:hypothetical protein
MEVKAESVDREILEYFVKPAFGPTGLGTEKIFHQHSPGYESICAKGLASSGFSF